MVVNFVQFVNACMQDASTGSLHSEYLADCWAQCETLQSVEKIDPATFEFIYEMSCYANTHAYKYMERLHMSLSELAGGFVHSLLMTIQAEKRRLNPKWKNSYKHSWTA